MFSVVIAFILRLLLVFCKIYGIIPKISEASGISVDHSTESSLTVTSRTHTLPVPASRP